MGRPKLAEDKKLSERFIFRLTKDELNRLEQAAQACGKAAGTLVRLKLFKGKFPAPATPQLDREVYVELKKTGVNINQLARKANSGVVPMGLHVVLMKLLRQQETIIAKLFHDRQPENR